VIGFTSVPALQHVSMAMSTDSKYQRKNKLLQCLHTPYQSKFTALALCGYLQQYGFLINAVLLWINSVFSTLVLSQNCLWILNTISSLHDN